jgi:ketosteroid isomerase-like protein
MNRPTNRLALALIPFLFATAAHAHSGLEAEIRTVDAQFRQAMIQGDVKQMSRIVADDAKIIHGGSGAIQDKQGLLDRFRTYHIHTYDRTPVLSKIDRNLAVLVSVTRKIADGRETDTSTTEVFVRRSGRWQLLILQNTDHSDS